MVSLASSRTVTESFPFNQQVAWEPRADWVAESNLQAFMDRHGIDSLDALQKRSEEDLEWFWDAVLEDLDIQFYRPYDRVVDLSRGMPFPEWCVGGEMNIYHNLMDKWLVDDRRHRVALRWEDEAGETETLTYWELNEEVCRCASVLREMGLGRGDAIGLYMPMTPEIVIAFLAIVKIGGIIIPLFSGYGPGAVVTRLDGAGAKAVFTADGFSRRGKTITLKDKIDEALTSCPTVEHVIVHRRLGLPDTPMKKGRDIWWTDALADKPTHAPTTRTRAEDVVMIIYTSGTTGKPKGAVHTHCGFPVKAAQDMQHCMDLKPEETMYWMSDMGWMMGPWLVFGTLLSGASMMLYDGAPDAPDAGRLWQLVERHGVSHLGISPTLIRALKAHGDKPVKRHDLASLRAVGSTGSPWDPDSWKWLFHTVLEGEKPIFNYSGGTEISGGILCGNLFRPLKPGAFSGPVPGMAADVVNADGDPIRQEVGELVIRKPWIGMTRSFHNEEQRYLDSYWNRFDDTWVHGDFATIDEDGLWYILGRSDDTINVAGKRLGPAEVEAILNADSVVAESAVIGVDHEVKGQDVVAFVVLNDPDAANDDVRVQLLQRVATELGKPLKPGELFFVTALPKTRNAKVMRRVIKAAYLDQDTGDVSSLEDPSTIDAIKQAS